jgi:hypothetical protein
MSMDDLIEMNDAEFEQAGYAYHKAVAAAEGAEVADPLENVSDEELMARWQQAADKELRKRHEADSFEAARQFVAECPEYVESQRNAERMSKYLEARIGKDATPTPDDLHEAFAVLKRRNLVEVRDLPREPRPTLTDADLYEMPLDDLHDLAVAEGHNPGRVRRVR